MTVIAIAHPRKKKHRLWLEFQEKLSQQGLEVCAHYSEWPGHSRELAKALCPLEGTVIVVGGDGTLNEVVNGWMGQQERGAPNFVLVPLGTGNDFARDQGIKASSQDLTLSVMSPQLKLVDVSKLTVTVEGVPTTRYFVVGATVGFSAEVTRFSQRLPRVLPGTAQYLLSLLLGLLYWKNEPVSIELDEELSHSGEMLNFNIANGRFYGGGMYSSPRALVDSGQLETVLMDLSKFEALKALPRTYSGKFDGVAGVSQKAAQSIRITSPKPVPVQADGEYLGTTPIEVEMFPQMMRLAKARL